MGTPRGKEHKQLQQPSSSSYKSPDFVLLETTGDGSRHASPALLCLASSHEHLTLTRQLSTVFKKSTASVEHSNSPSHPSKSFKARSAISNLQASSNKQTKTLLWRPDMKKHNLVQLTLLAQPCPQSNHKETLFLAIFIHKYPRIWKNNISPSKMSLPDGSSKT